LFIALRNALACTRLRLRNALVRVMRPSIQFKP
jgi:hypothetical protein